MLKFIVQSEKAVAVDSPDHLVPRGTKQDNSRNTLFNKKLYALLGCQPLQILDFGCAGGGFVKDCIDNGHIAIGIEGSDYSQKMGRAEWSTIPNNLFTGDLTAELYLKSVDETSGQESELKLDVITAWEFMEHIKTEDLPQICKNAIRHLQKGGIWIMSIADFEDVVDGVRFHQTVQSQDWWENFFRSAGFRNHPHLVNYFGNDWVRGPLQGSRSFHLILTYGDDEPPAIPSTPAYDASDLYQTGVMFFNQGVTTRDGGNMVYAVLCFDEAIKLRPQDSEIHYARAMTLLNLGRFAEAQVAAKSVLVLQPNHAGAHAILATITPQVTTATTVQPSSEASRPQINNVQDVQASGNSEKFDRDRNLPLTRYLLGSGILKQNPMRIVDAGASGGAEIHWNVYGDQIHLIGFEPDAQECDRLNRLAKTSRSRHESYYPVAVYRDKSIKTLYVTKNLLASSFFKVNSRLVERFPQAEPGDVISSIQVQTTDIDSFMEENSLDYIDFIKLDIEGAELAALEGANQLLSESLLGLYVEVFFQPYHVDRPLFGDIDQYLRKFGFVLFDLKPEKWRRKSLATTDPKSWYGEGQIIWANALYLRDLTAEIASASYRQVKSDRVKVLKLASLAELFGLQDFSIELVQNATQRGLLSARETEEINEVVEQIYARTGSKPEAEVPDSSLPIHINLREINLIVFPDWSQPEESVSEDLAEVIRTVLTHPEKSRLALLIDTSNIAEENANLILSGVMMKLLLQENLSVDDGAEICPIGMFSEAQWTELLRHVNLRIMFTTENQQVIQQVGAANFPVCKLRDLKMKRFTHSKPNNFAIYLEHPVNPLPRYGYGKPAHSKLYEIIDKNRDKYADNLKCFLKYIPEWSEITINGNNKPTEPFWRNGFFQGLDAIALYGFLCMNEPKRYFEIGSGNSTKFAKLAINNHKLKTKIISLDPQPRSEIESLCDRAIRQPLEDVEISLFEELEENDILFIDNSHCCFTNSDVTVFFLDILPNLKPGTLVHLHDIFLPYDYPPEWQDRYYAEQYLLASYMLAEGNKFEVVLPNAFIAEDSELQSLLAPIRALLPMNGLETSGVSFWLKMK